MTTTTGEYPMQRWVFEDAAGRFDIDLGDSNMIPGRLDQLSVPPGLDLDYGHDRASARCATGSRTSTAATVPPSSSPRGPSRPSTSSTPPCSPPAPR